MNTKFLHNFDIPDFCVYSTLTCWIDWGLLESSSPLHIDTESPKIHLNKVINAAHKFSNPARLTSALTAEAERLTLLVFMSHKAGANILHFTLKAQC